MEIIDTLDTTYLLYNFQNTILALKIKLMVFFLAEQ